MTGIQYLTVLKKTVNDFLSNFVFLNNKSNGPAVK